MALVGTMATHLQSTAEVHSLTLTVLHPLYIQLHSGALWLAHTLPNTDPNCSELYLGVKCTGAIMS